MGDKIGKQSGVIRRFAQKPVFSVNCVNEQLHKQINHDFDEEVFKGVTSRFVDLFKFVVCNSCQSSPSFAILVPISLVFLCLRKLLFSVSIYLKFKDIWYEAKITQNILRILLNTVLSIPCFFIFQNYLLSSELTMLCLHFPHFCHHCSIFCCYCLAPRDPPPFSPVVYWSRLWFYLMSSRGENCSRNSLRSWFSFLALLLKRAQ